MTEEKGANKGRPIWMKTGSYKYLLELLTGIKRELRLLRKTLKYIAVGLDSQLFFDKDFIRDVACKDEVDEAILNFLRNTPPSGVLPKTISREVGQVTPWQVTLRIRNMNKKLDTQIGQHVAEKRGLRWACTSFIETSWQEEEEKNDSSAG